MIGFKQRSQRGLAKNAKMPLTLVTPMFSDDVLECRRRNRHSHEWLIGQVLVEILEGQWDSASEFAVRHMAALALVKSCMRIGYDIVEGIIQELDECQANEFGWIGTDTGRPAFEEAQRFGTAIRRMNCQKMPLVLVSPIYSGDLAGCRKENRDAHERIIGPVLVDVLKGQDSSPYEMAIRHNAPLTLIESCLTIARRAAKRIEELIDVAEQTGFGWFSASAN